jgi:hypothetical protein
MKFSGLNKTKFLLAAITPIAFIALVSCGNNIDDSKQTQQPPVQSTNIEQTSTANGTTPAPGQNESAMPTAGSQPPPAGMLNPPHGQPHHRCDIAVGAPLNSSPTNTTKPTTNTQVQPAATKPPAAPSVTNTQMGTNAAPVNTLPTPTQTNENPGSKPRLNPPHGQPYHRCDIQVGSPLEG